MYGPIGLPRPIASLSEMRRHGSLRSADHGGVELKLVLLKFQGLGFWSFSSPYDIIQLYDTIMCSLSEPLGYPFRCFWGYLTWEVKVVLRCSCAMVGNWSRVGKEFALFGCLPTELAIRVPDQGD